MRYYYEKYKGKNCYKLFEEIHGKFAGISKNTLRNWIISNCQHCAKHPIFQNKDCLKLVVAEKPMDIC